MTVRSSEITCDNQRTKLEKGTVVIDHSVPDWMLALWPCAIISFSDTLRGRGVVFELYRMQQKPKQAHFLDPIHLVST